MNNRFTYLDYNATTPLDSRVLDEMMPYYCKWYGNASSLHSFGDKAKKAVDEAREKIADLIQCHPSEVIYTSGATESVNMALKGLALNSQNYKKHIITCQTEHKAVLETCKYLESVGFEIDYLPVNRSGIIDLELLRNSIRKDTLLVCIMWVNNETGVIQPAEEVGKIAKEKEVYFVCDGTQGVGKLDIDVRNWSIDVLCFSGHKMYAPKGIGGLFLSSESINKRDVLPILHGGGQEDGLRGGTYNVPLIVGLGKACEIALKEMADNSKPIGSLKSHLERELLRIDGCFINGGGAQRIYNTTNVCLPNFDSDVFIGMNKDMAISNGAACSSALIQSSHVLLAMGLTNEEAMNSLRISLGKENTEEEIQIICQKVVNFIGIQSS